MKTRTLILILSLATFAVANDAKPKVANADLKAEPAKAVTIPTTPIPDGFAKDIIISFQKAQIANDSAVDANNMLNAANEKVDTSKAAFARAVAEFKKVVATTAEKLGYPKGTDFVINWDTGEVTPKFPDAKPEKK